MNQLVKKILGIADGYFVRAGLCVDLNEGNIFINGKNTGNPLNKANELKVFIKLASNMGQVIRYVDLVAQVDPDAYSKYEGSEDGRVAIKNRCRFYKHMIKIKLQTDTIIQTKSGKGYFIPLP